MTAAGQLRPAELEALEESSLAGRLGRGLLQEGLLHLVRQVLVTSRIVASPAAGADWSVTVPAGEQWDVLACRGRLVTSAAVATRVVDLQIGDGQGNILVDVAPVSTHTASLTGVYSYAFDTTGTAQTSSRLSMSSGLPELTMKTGWTLGAVTSNIDVADQWSQLTLTARVWTPLRLRRAVEAVLADLDSAGGLR